MSLIGFKLASRPADKGHPYGHGRFEYLAGMAIAMLVVAVGIQLAWQSIGKIATPRALRLPPSATYAPLSSAANSLTACL